MKALNSVNILWIFSPSLAPSDGFDAPYVKESQLKMAMHLEQTIDIEANGTILVIGSIQHFHVKESAVSDNGQLDLSDLGVAAISGLNRYYQAEGIGNFPYARVSELPNF